MPRPITTTTFAPLETPSGHNHLPKDNNHVAALPILSTEVVDPSPLDQANWFSQLTLAWLTPLMRLGAASPLVDDDIPALPSSDTAAVLHHVFQRHWDAELATSKPQLMRALGRTFRTRLSTAFGLLVFAGAVSFVQPIAIKSLLQYLQSPDGSIDLGVRSGYGLAGLLAGSTLLSVTLGDYAQFVATRVGLTAKLVVMDVVFAKVLRLSLFATNDMTIGQVVTLASVDAERIFAGFMFGLWVFISPIMLTATFVLLGLTELGWLPAVAGGATLAISLVVGYQLGAKVGGIRRQLLAVQSDRVKLTHEMLQGIRVVKMYGWEAPLEAQLAQTRAAELMWLRQYQAYRMFNTVALSVAPVLALAVCLMVFVGQGHTLSTPIAFTALAYVNIARQPTIVFASSVMSLTEALASCHRLATFLTADEVGPQLLLSSTQDDAIIQGEVASPHLAIEQGDFSWSVTHAIPCEPDALAPHLTLRNINLLLQPKSLTIVVGAVGSGKSSLISALLGEIHQVRGTQTRDHSRFAYVSQEAWIQHATLKDNIVFDSPYDDTYYHQVLAACQLETDLAMLPEGDATEIGERGINLSGGQKARVSLARAMYCRRANVYLLDDPLSALDVHVANAVFDQCVEGLLRDKTTVLVLNSH
ncbi:hypothetical protein As57867_015547, partial [Aphanomyces stellatus]